MTRKDTVIKEAENSRDLTRTIMDKISEVSDALEIDESNWGLKVSRKRRLESTYKPTVSMVFAIGQSQEDKHSLVDELGKGDLSFSDDSTVAESAEDYLHIFHPRECQEDTESVLRSIKAPDVFLG